SFFDAEQAQELGYSMLNNGFDRLVAFFALCLVAPVTEELIFRGWLYAKLREKIPSKHLSIILSTFLVSLLFGILHGQWNVGVNVFAMSLVLCALREITGTVYSGILLHILKNTVAFVLVYIIGYGS
ncbi:CPBP family intramembrane metalloprotease, partial [Candidatus Saccharibacteria bacterium]|nr:CPBP family intramembrane metalloprotease [Candidatus Saccharibacteria bacterium]